MNKVKLKSVITCPVCGKESEEIMPEYSCTYFWECEECGEVSRAEEGDCCVYCSYAETPCPPVQREGTC